MRKTYVRPDVYLESYALSNAIASGCNAIITSIASYNCSADVMKDPASYTIIDVGLFGDGINCLTDYSVFQQYCYYNGSNKIFTS